MSSFLKTVLIFIFMLSHVFILSCDKNSAKPDDKNIFYFEGITSSDVQGNIINVDPDDWKATDIFTPSFAYPNPAGRDSVQWYIDEENSELRPGCFLTFELKKQAVLKISINQSPDEMLTILTHFRHSAGKYLFHWNLKNRLNEPFPNGVYRVYFTVWADSSVYDTYGDIEIISQVENSNIQPVGDQKCFLVSWKNVTVENFWNSGSAQYFTFNYETARTETISTENETHALAWKNIVYQSGDIVSFDVKIDGIDFSYPEDMCK